MSGYLWSSDRSVRGHSREHVPAECLSRNVIMYGLTVCTWGGLYLSRNEKKAAFSFYSSPTIYNGWVMWRKELIKKKGSYPLLSMKKDVRGGLRPGASVGGKMVQYVNCLQRQN